MFFKKCTVGKKLWLKSLPLNILKKKDFFLNIDFLYRPCGECIQTVKPDVPALTAVFSTMVINKADSNMREKKKEREGLGGGGMDKRNKEAVINKLFDRFSKTNNRWSCVTLNKH